MGAASGVGALALQMAHRAGARVLAVVRRADQLPSVRAMGAAEAWLAEDPALVDQIRRAAPEGVHRIPEPGTYALFLFGLAAVAGVARRRAAL